MPVMGRPQRLRVALHLRRRWVDVGIIVNKSRRRASHQRRDIFAIGIEPVPETVLQETVQIVMDVGVIGGDLHVIDQAIDGHSGQRGLLGGHGCKMQVGIANGPVGLGFSHLRDVRRPGIGQARSGGGFHSRRGKVGHEGPIGTSRRQTRNRYRSTGLN